MTEREHMTREQELFKAFCAGFAISAEGWNGEYPFNDGTGNFAASPELQTAFGEFMHALNRAAA